MSIPYYRALRAAGLIDAHYIFRAGVCYDVIGGRVLDVTGCFLQRNGLSIPSLQQSLSSGNNLQGVTELTSMVRFSATEVGSTIATGVLFSDIGAVVNKGHQIGFSKTDQRINADFQSSTGTLSIISVAAGFVGFNKTAWASLTIKNDDAGKLFLNGTQVGSSANMAGKTYVVGGPLCFGNRNGATRHCSGLFMEYIGIKQALTEAQQQTLIDELDNQIVYDWNSGGIVIDPATGATLFDYKGGWGIVESTANEGGATGTPISNTEWVCGDATGRFKVVTQTGPNGQRGKGIKCITGGTLTKLSVTAGGTWTYHWYDDSATAWKTQADAIHAGATFTLAANDILWIADEAGPRAHDIRHTPA